jgi:hypothetical protein
LIGHTSQVYAIRQALAKAIVAFYQKFVDEAAKKEIKEILVQYDRTLLVADPRRCEPKKVNITYSIEWLFLLFKHCILIFLSFPFSSVVPVLVPVSKSLTVKKIIYTFYEDYIVGFMPLFLT